MGINSFQEFLSTAHDIVEQVEDTAFEIVDASDVEGTTDLAEAMNQLCERCPVADVLMAVSFVVAQAIHKLEPYTRSVTGLAVSQLVARAIDLDKDEEDEEGE